MTEHRLKIRCPTWDRLENFYERKVKAGNTLLARVPFLPEVGSPLVLVLELPDSVVVEIPAKVTGVRQAPDGRRSAIRMHLYGLDSSLRERLMQAVQLERGEEGRATPLALPVLNTPSSSRVSSALPSDVPIDELVPNLILPNSSDVPGRVRELYQELETLLGGLREKAAHDVLAVRWDADISEIRQAYFVMVKKVHPDVLARYDSPAISLLASEIFIYINQAYDRLRDSVVASGKAIAAGPALLPHSGWIANFDEIGTVRPRKALRTDDLSAPVAVIAKEESVSIKAPTAHDSVVVQFSKPSKKKKTASLSALQPLVASAPRLGLEEQSLFEDAFSEEESEGTEKGGILLSEDFSTKPEGDVSALLNEANQLLREGGFAEARIRFAQVLEISPRDREARAMYHLSFARELLSKDREVEAMTQLDVALQHDSDCEEAKEMLAAAKKGGDKKSGLFRRWFR